MTKRLNESASEFILKLDEYDADGNLTDSKECEERYSTEEDVLYAIYDTMKHIMNNEGIDKSEIEEYIDDNQHTYTVDGVGEWVFTIVPNEDENTNTNDTDDVTYMVLSDDDDDATDDDDDEANESVAERFAKLRSLFESDENDDDNSDDNLDEDSKDDPDDNSDDDSDDDSKDDSDEDSKDDSDEDSDDDSDEEMKAVVITVKKGDEDKCKDELIDAGIDEDDIEILDADDDDDDEDVEIRIDVNSIMELKDYLSKKGIDLEEEIGGEIVSDDDEKSDDDEEGSDDEKGDDEEELDFDDLGDIFGADEE